MVLPKSERNGSTITVAWSNTCRSFEHRCATERSQVQRILEELGLCAEIPELSPPYDPSSGQLVYDEKLDILLEVDCDCRPFPVDIDPPHTEEYVEQSFICDSYPLFPEHVDPPHPDEYIDEDYGFEINQAHDW